MAVCLDRGRITPRFRIKDFHLRLKLIRIKPRIVLSWLGAENGALSLVFWRGPALDLRWTGF